AAQAAREGDQAAVQLTQELLVDAWLVVEALAVARADQPAEVAVPLLVHGQHDHVVVAAGLVVVDTAGLVEAAVGRDVELAADDRLHARLLRLGEELDGAEHVAVVGDGAGVHPGGPHPRQELLDLVRPVEQRVLRVQVQVDERHRPVTPLPRAVLPSAGRNGSARLRRWSTAPRARLEARTPTRRRRSPPAAPRAWPVRRAQTCSVPV